jgi:dTDP-4-dehydrorhamnose reductase
MRVLLTGAKGLLGQEVADHLKLGGHEAILVGHEFDVSDPTSSAKIATSAFGDLDWLINCAAYTAVDQAESDAQAAYDVNGLGPSFLGDACAIANVKLLHVSTDFVFNGSADAPYKEEDPTDPINAYGRSKLAGESALGGNFRAVTVRTSWLFGPRGRCFPRSILRALSDGRSLTVVADQFGTPTYTPHLAARMVQIIETNPFPGIYHVAGPETVSWHEFAGRILTEWGVASTRVQPISTSDWPTAARRPAFSALCSDKILTQGIEPFPALDVAISEFCAILRGEEERVGEI